MYVEPLETLAAELPEIDEAALNRAAAAEAAAAPIPAPAAPGRAEPLRDKAGNAFDPAIHETDDAGKPVYRSGRDGKGLFRKRRGPKGKAAPPPTSTTPKPSPAQASYLPPLDEGPPPPPEISESDTTAAELAELSLLPARIFWNHEPSAAQEYATARAWQRVCERYAFKAPPPSLELALALGMVYAPLVQRSLSRPENLTRIQKLKIRVLGWFFKGRKPAPVVEPGDN